MALLNFESVSMFDYAAIKFVARGEKRPKFRWLTMTPMANACMFCKHPVGETYSVCANPHSYDDMSGYLTCEKCKDAAQNIISDIRNEAVAAVLACTAGKECVKVMRTNGAIEDDWSLGLSPLGKPLITILDDFTQFVHVEQKAGGILKRVPLASFVTLNT